jgi:WD40 repeat protein
MLSCNLSLICIGDRIALFTRDEGHTLRIYDPTRTRSRPSVTLELDRFSSGHAWVDEVIGPSFSDDGVFLAVPRSDNEIHVYDARFLVSPLFVFSHQAQKTAHSGAFGIVKAEWIEGEFGCVSRGLVTGGNDGKSMDCVCRINKPLMGAANRLRASLGFQSGC